MDMLLKYLKLSLSGMVKYQRTVDENKVAPLFREPHIHTEYRLPYKPWTYYLTSLLQLHNESVNIWSHFVAIWIFLYQIVDYNDTMDYLNDPLAWAFLSFAFGTLSYSILSTFAHTFQSKSELVHYFSFQMDYIGIGLNSLGTGISFYFFVANEHFYKTWGCYYLVMCVTLAILICVFLTCAKLKYARPYPPERKLIVVGIMIVTILAGFAPIYYVTYDCVIEQNWPYFWNSIYPHLYYSGFFVISGIFYATHIPEIFFPGKLDIFGQGHQIFHSLMMYTSFLQYKTLYKEFITRPKHLIQLASPSFQTTLLLPIIVMLVDLVFILILTKSYRLKRSKEECLKFVNDKIN